MVMVSTVVAILVIRETVTMSPIVVDPVAVVIVAAGDETVTIVDDIVAVIVASDETDIIVVDFVTETVVTVEFADERIDIALIVVDAVRTYKCIIV